MNDDEFIEFLDNFAENLFSHQKELPKEFKEILNNNLWELIADGEASE